jgi:hypothetical protein
MNEVIFAIRRLRKHPQQLAAGILAFMLGIGLNTAMYSIADVILFRPLELKSLDRLWHRSRLGLWLFHGTTV